MVTISWCVWDWSPVLLLKVSFDKCTPQGDHLGNILGENCCLNSPRRPSTAISWGYGSTVSCESVLSLRRSIRGSSQPPPELWLQQPPLISLPSPSSPSALTLWLTPHLSYYTAVSWLFCHMVLFSHLDLNSKGTEILSFIPTATAPCPSIAGLNYDISRCWLISTMPLLEWAVLSPSMPHTASTYRACRSS